MLSIRDKIVLFPVWLLAVIPIIILFQISKLLYFVVYYLVRYRRKVVFDNVKNSFPDKTVTEITRIVKRFYLHLGDAIFETIKGILMPVKKVDQRFKCLNPELVDELYRNNKSIIMMMSHYGNWEWASGMPYWVHHKVYGIYKPLSNKTINRLFIYIRSKYGVVSTPMKQTLRVIKTARNQNQKFILLLVSDQRPEWGDLNRWIRFMNQETPVITGPEKLAKKFGLAVLFPDVVQVRRGYYEYTLRLISDGTEKYSETDLSSKYFQFLEEQIKRNPEYYMWSHKRWKYNKDDIPGVNEYLA